jgi:hypothetical protein
LYRERGGDQAYYIQRAAGAVKWGKRKAVGVGAHHRAWVLRQAVLERKGGGGAISR